MLWCLAMVCGLLYASVGFAEVTVVHEGDRRPAAAETKEAEEPAEEESADEETAEDELAEDESSATRHGDRLGKDARRSGRVSRGTRLRSIDRKIERLREERSEYGIGGPITMISLGGATLMISFYVIVLTSSYCADPAGCDAEAPTGAYVAAGIGAGLGIWGGVLLSERLGPRRKLGKQIIELEKEREYMKYETRLLPIVTPSTVGLALRSSF